MSNDKRSRISTSQKLISNSAQINTLSVNTSGIVEVKDEFFRIINDNNTTQLFFDTSNLTPGSSKTLSVQDASGTLALIADMPTYGSFTPNWVALSGITLGAGTEFGYYHILGNIVIVHVTREVVNTTVTSNSFVVTIDNLPAIYSSGGFAWGGVMNPLSGSMDGALNAQSMDFNNTTVALTGRSDILGIRTLSATICYTQSV